MRLILMDGGSKHSEFELRKADMWLFCGVEANFITVNQLMIWCIVAL